MKKREKTKWSVLLTIGLFIYFTYLLVNQQTVLNQCNKDLLSIGIKIEEQTRRNEDLQKKKELLTSDEYIEEVAREELGMVKEGEKVFVDVNK